MSIRQNAAIYGSLMFCCYSHDKIDATAVESFSSVTYDMIYRACEPRKEIGDGGTSPTPEQISGKVGNNVQQRGSAIPQRTIINNNNARLVCHFQTIPLSFTFYFYGHEINQITIATGGKTFPDPKTKTLPLSLPTQMQWRLL